MFLTTLIHYLNLGNNLSLRF